MEKRLKKVNILDALDNNMMSYTSYILMNRVLPKIEDGYRASQTRILIAMNNMKADKFTKCQQIDGETIGKYHPHGGVYGVMVNMTTTNYQNIQPIIGKGNFGDKNSSELTPAAARYTEAKLSKLALDMLEGTKENEVEFEYNFDETMMVPKFIPFKYPNILCNNLQGMAVGFATDIPSFNMKEVCEATIKYINTGEHTILVPDYPTKGMVMRNEEALESIAKTGKGTIYIKSRVEIDEKNREIIIREIPYTTTREAIVNKVVDLVKEKKIHEISDVKDLSGKRGQKIVIYYKRGTNVENLLDRLYAMTPMMSSHSANMNLIVDGQPRLLGTHKIIEEWVKARRKAVQRGLEFNINKKESRLNILKGLEKVLLDIDKTIEIIRFSEEPEKDLMKHFDINLEQATYICDMKLRNINKAMIEKRIKDIKNLEEEIKHLKSKNNIEGHNNIICEQLEKCIKEYSVPRNSEIIDYEIRKIVRTAKKVEDNKKYRVILTKENYIKKTSQNGDIKLKDGDKVVSEMELDGNAEIACLLNDCTCRKIRIKDISESNVNTLGDYLPVLLGLKNEKILHSMLLNKDLEGYVLALFKNNKINKIDIKEYLINRRLIEKAYCEKNDGIIYIGYHKDDISLKIEGNKKAVIVNTKNIRAKGRTATGIQTLPKSEKIRKVSFIK